MPFVEGGIVVDAEPQQQAAPPMAQGGFVQGGIEVDPTPEDSYNKVLQYKAAQTDYTPTKQEFLDYLKVGKEKSIDLKGAAAAFGPGLAHIAALPYRLGEAIGDIYQPPEGATEGDVAAATFAETAIQAKLKAQSLYRGISASIVDKLDQLPLLIQSKEDRARMESMLDDIKYVDFLEKADIDRKLALANAPQEQRVPASQEFLQTYNIPQEAIGQAGVEVGGFLADPSSIAFAGGGKLASVMAKQAVAQIPRAAEMLRGAGERVSQLGRVPENLAGSLTAKVTGSPQMGQAVQEGVSKGTTTIAVGEAAGIPITMNVPVLGTASQVIGATKGLGATMETVGEAGAASRGPALTPVQRGLLGAGERIAAAEGASSKARALGTALARSGLETPVKLAANILVPMTGAAAGGGLLAAMSGEEADAISAAIGSGAAFGVFDGGFRLGKAVEANVFNGRRVRQTAVDDLNTRPTEVQFTYVDPVAGEQTATIKDSEARATLYGRLNNKQLTKALSEIAGAESGGIEVIFHTDADTVPTALQTVNYAGVAIGPDNIKSGKPTVLINVDRASPDTLPHEILHARITQAIKDMLGGKVIDTSSQDPDFKKQFTDFANAYADKLESRGGRVISDRIRTELRDAFDPALERAQQINALNRITDEFAAYYTQEFLKGKDPKTMLPGRIPSFIELALNNAKEAVSERFTRRALQAGFDPVARTFYDANGRRIKLDWMEDAIKNLVNPKEGYEPTEQKVDTSKMTKAQQNAVIMARGYSDLFMTAPDGSIIRPLSKAELAAKTADVANRTMRVVESVPQAERTSVSGMDAKGNPVIEGRLSLREADALSQSGIFSPSTSRYIIDIATAIRDGTLMEGKYWKVYGSTGKSGVFGESDKLFLPYGISINSKGGVNVKVVDWGKVQARMYKALTKPTYKNLFRNYDQAMSTLKDVYLKNIAEQNAVPSADALGGGREGAKKRNFFNEVMGAVPRQGDVMSNLPTAGYVANRKGGSVYQDLRIERIQNAQSTGSNIPWSGDMGEQSSYRRTQLNFQPAETIGETTVSTDQNAGYRILSKNGKFRLYGPDGSPAGIFDTQEQAKLKAEKDYATQARLQPEVDQQQRVPGDEGRQTAEAGGGNRALGGTEGGQEGRQADRTVRQAGDVRFMPEEEQLTPEQRKAVSAAKKRSVEVSRKYPEALRLEIQTDRNGRPKLEPILDDEGNPMLDAKGKPMMEVSYSKESYDLLGSPKISKNRDRAVLQTADLLESDARKAINVPDIQKGIGWYSRMREFLQQQFGANIEIFGQLLGATSARTPVDTNFRQALEALRMLSTGKYDDLLADFGKYSAQVYADAQSGDLFRQWREKNPGKRDSQFKVNDEIRKRINAYEGIPLRENGKKFNANSKKVLHVLYNVWLDQTVGPKTPNFAGNLTGRTLKATIDVWAARNLRRLLYEGANKKWRLLPEQESGVTDPDFFFAQDVYDVVGKRLGMNADDLQALMWFMEKDVWEKNGWTSTVGAEKSSFDKEAGKLALDRYQAGVTTFTSPEQYKPEIQEQERMALRKSIAKIPGMTSSRVTLSDGLYGDYLEPSLDVEFSVQRNKDGSSQNISEQVSEILRIASEQGRKQNDVFVSKVVDENHPNARPMVEIGFKKAASPEDVQAVVQAFRSNGVDGFTIAKDARGNVIGIRSQYIPEISARFDTIDHIDQAKFIGFADQWISNVKKSLSSVEQIDNVSYKNPGWVSTTVYGIEEYSTAKPKDNGRTSRREELDRRRAVLQAGQIPGGAAPVEGVESGSSGLPTAGANVPGQSTSGASEVGGQRFMPSDMASGRGVNTHREAMDLFEKGYRIYGAPYDGMEDPIRLKKIDEIENYDPENLWAVPSKKIAAAISVRNMPADIQRDIGRNQDFATPPTDSEAIDALSSEKKPKFGAARSIKPGTQVAARIDIPAFLRTGKYVVAVHEPDGAAGGPGKVIGYDTVTRLQNPKFVVKPGVQRIYEGKSAKFPVATVDGKIMADRSIPDDLENYVPVGMDPKEHAYFYDKRTDQPVIGGSESVSVGNTVFVKNPVYGDPSQFAFMPMADSSMPGAYSFTGGYRALPGKSKGSLRIYSPAGSLIGIAASLDEAQRIIRKKARQ